jgi:predicted DNA-binding transcriptional regulator AlpA
MKSSELLDPAGAGKFIGVSKPTWLSMVQKNQAPKPIVLGKRIFWPKSVLEKWISEGCQLKESE